MARGKSLIKASKHKERRDPLFMDEKYVGEEPVWDYDRAIEFNDETFEHHLRNSWRYYNYFFTAKDMRKYVIVWAKEHMKLTKEELAAYTASSPELTPMTVCGLVKAEMKGMPMREKHRDYIISKIRSIISYTNPTVSQISVAKETKKKPEVAAPTIQDRLAEKTAEIIGEIEGELDLVIAGKPQTMKIYDFLTAKTFAQGQVVKVREIFTKQAQELALAMGGTDAQLVEGYANYTKAIAKRVMAFYEALFDDLDSYAAVKKATRSVRAKRPQSKDKMVAKVRYMKEDKALKIVSINPVDIIGASTLWLYHPRFRKLACYVADSHTGSLGIKGNAVVGFDPAKSVWKTLRKPEETLKEFAKASKVQLRTFMQNIKAVETKINGRLGDELLLLKVA